MGSDCEVYCGVYIKLPRKISLTATEKTRCSIDKKHRVSRGDAFCPVCGNETVIEYDTKSEEKPIRPTDQPFNCYQDFFVPDSCLNIDNYTIWLINSRNDSSRLGVDDDFVTKITPDSINETLEAFHQRHRILLEKINKETGNGAIVEFGVLQYWY